MMKKRGKNIFVLMTLSATVFLTSCDTLQSGLEMNRLREEKQSTERAYRENVFKAEVERAFSQAVIYLESDMYKNLGKAKSPETDYSARNIDYDMMRQSATVRFTIWTVKGKREIAVRGYLRYNSNGTVEYYCTDAEGPYLPVYIKKLQKGITLALQ